MSSKTEYDSTHVHARSSRVWTGLVPIGYFVMAIFFAVLHHFINATLNGTPVNFLVDFEKDTLKALDLDAPLKKFLKVQQRYQHWVLNICAFMFKSYVIRSMNSGLLQHAWKSLRTTDLNVRQIDCIIALQHRKISGLFSWTVFSNCFPTYILAIISMIIPSAAIFPAGSLTVVERAGVSVYAYNVNWLVGPYALALAVTFITILFGTHVLHKHNTTNLTFSFSHILAVTRNTAFDDALQNANIHHVPEKVMAETVSVLRFGLMENGREGFAHPDELMNGNEETNQDEGNDESSVV